MVMRFLKLGRKFFYLVAMIWVIFCFAPVLSASAATSVPADNAQGVKVDSKITVTFSSDVSNYRIDSTQISLTDTSHPRTLLNFEVIHDPNDPRSIIIIPKLVKASDPDFFLLDFQKEYKVSITANALMYGPIPLGEPYEFTFKTVKQFSNMTKDDLNLLINQYSPSGIHLMVQTKHITNLNISYASVDANKKPLAKPLTNVDMTVDSSVAEIRTCFVNTTWIAAKKSGSSNLLWNAGYAGEMTNLSSDGKTQIGKDIKIRAYDENDRVIESYTVKIDPKGLKKEDFKNDNVLAAQDYTLDQLITDGGKKLIDILKVFPLDALQVETYLTD
jgi:hypothetical protein